MTGTRRIGLFLLGAILVAAIGCTPDTPQAPNVPLLRAGVRVIAVGDGLVAGIMNGGLRNQGQVDGVANLISRTVSRPDVPMEHPLVNAPGIGIDPQQPGTGTLRVAWPSGAVVRDPIPGYGDDPQTAILALLRNLKYPVPYDNLGIPFALTSFLTGQTRTDPVNPLTSFYDPILRNSALPPGDTTQMDQVENLAMTVGGEPLLVLWTGTSDILFPLPIPSVSAGGAVFGGGAVTPPAEFETAFNAVVARVEALGVSMVAVGNVPDVTSLPFFTTVPTFVPWRTQEADVQMILLSTQNLQPPLFLQDGTPNPDYLLGTGAEEIPASMTLTSAELSAIDDAIDGYNQVIETAAQARGWALADVNDSWGQLVDDPTACPLNAEYAWGPFGIQGALAQNKCAAFGLDGLHPSERGYGLTANVFLSAINTTYGTSYPLYTPADIQNTNGFEEVPPDLPDDTL